MSESAAPQTTSIPVNPKRKPALLIVTGVFALAALGYGVHWWLHLADHESTDNAYVQGNVIQITPQVAGTVLTVAAQDTDFVKAGQTLVKLDPADAQVALEQAEAQLAQTVREVRTLYANNGSLGAAVALRQADVVRLQTDVTRAEQDLARRSSLVASGAVSREELQHVQDQLASAKAALTAAQAGVVAAREQLGSNQSLTDGVPAAEHPSVQRAAAKVREAWLAVRRADLPAPVTGYVARRSVQVGQRVAPGTPLMSVIALDQLWVDANFKEVQLRGMRIGQPAVLSADVYGTKVQYHGTIAGLGAGTGAAFALLPAQNATGNWIKVVQRIPVRIALDPAEVAAHPLRVGLSMQVDVDVRDQSGKTLADAPSSAPANATRAFDEADDAGAALVKRIIAINLGQKVSAVGASHIAQRGQTQPVSSLRVDARLPKAG
jgi:membrane fusion protein (multidrug efflux system)